MTEDKPFDHHSPEHATDPVGDYARLRHQGIVRSERHGGFAVLTRFTDITEVADDHTRFSNALELPGPEGFGGGITLPHNPAGGRMSLAEMDPPDWRPLRRMLNPMFKPAAVARFAARLKEITDECIDRVIEAGECDLVFDLCSPIPAIVALEYVGIPTDAWKRFAEPIHKLAYADRDHPDSPEFQQLNADFQWIYEQVRQIIAARRHDSGDGDILAALLNAGEGEEKLDDDLVFETVVTFLVAGIETTTALLGSALVHLQKNPEDRRRLIEDPTLIPTACEEFLRCYSPSQATARTVTTDTVIAGEQFHRGDRLLLAWSSANRDDELFERAGDFVLDRKPNRHLSFGYGIHRCVGAPLGRQEFVVALAQILERMPDFEIDLTKSHPYPDLGLNYGYMSIPATYTPGNVRGPELTAS